MPQNGELGSRRSIDEQLMEIDDEMGVPRKAGGNTGEYVDRVIDHLRELREEDVKLRAGLHSSTFYKWLKPSESVQQDETPTEKEFESVALDLVESRIDSDARSVWVGNVDYEATAEELDEHFKGCGAIERITIQVDKYTSHPKGFAYIEFADKENVDTALALDGSMFRDRPIKVCSKRTNKPGISTTNRPPLGRGYYQSRSSYYHQGWRPSYHNYYRGYAPRFTRGYGLYRSRRPNYYTPY